MEDLICDFYSPGIYRDNVEPVFTHYYNIEFREGFVMDGHRHDRTEVMYIKKGSCQVIAGNDTHRLEAGDFILLNAGVSHKLFVDRHFPCGIVCLEFAFKKNNKAPGLISHTYQNTKQIRDFIEERIDVIRLKDTNGIYKNIFSIYTELETSGFGKEIVLQASFCEFIIKLARLALAASEKTNDDINAYVNKAMAFMSEKYSEEISIDMAAEHVNLNTSYFYKIFKQVTQRTPAEYLNSIRMSKAKTLLERSDIPINDICFYTGFNSRQYFSYAFRKYTGMTPGQYRKNILTDNRKDRLNDSCFGMRD